MTLRTKGACLAHTKDHRIYRLPREVFPRLLFHWMAGDKFFSVRYEGGIDTTFRLEEIVLVTDAPPSSRRTSWLDTLALWWLTRKAAQVDKMGVVV